MLAFIVENFVKFHSVLGRFEFLLDDEGLERRGPTKRLTDYPGLSFLEAHACAV